MALEELNSLAKDEFVARLGGVFEHSPWVAAEAWRKRPFRSLDDLHRAMMQAVSLAPLESRTALVRAHPELGAAGDLTAASTGEQGRLGFNALTEAERQELGDINRRYREKFGFPCIVALRLHVERRSVIAEMRRRLANDAPSELDNALAQIGHIARGRLEKVLDG